MDADVWKYVLTGSGLLLELCGLVLVLLDARKARQDARKVVSKQLEVRLADAINVRSRVVATLSGGTEKNIEQRLTDLESSTAVGMDALEQRIEDVAEQARSQASTEHTNALLHADQLDRDLRTFIADALRGGRARLGVVFFALGATLSAASNLVG